MNRRGFLASSSALALAPHAAAAAQSPIHITLGDDVFLSETWHELANRQIGIVTNQTGVTASRESIVDAVHHRTSLSIKALFAPEHGLRGDRPAGAYVPSDCSIPC